MSLLEIVTELSRIINWVLKTALIGQFGLFLCPGKLRMCSTSLQPTDVINWWLKIGAGDQIILKQPMIIKRCQMIARGGSRWVPGKGHRLWYCKLLCGVAWYCNCMVMLYGIVCYCMVSVSLTNNIASADQRTPRSPPNLTKLLSKSSLNWASSNHTV